MSIQNLFGSREGKMGNEKIAFDQPYTFLVRHPIPGSELLTRSFYVIGFFLIIDIILIGFFVYKVVQKKKKAGFSESFLEADQNVSISLGLYTSDT